MGVWKRETVGGHDATFVEDMGLFALIVALCSGGKVGRDLREFGAESAVS